MANAFGDQCDRFVVLPPEDRSLDRLAKRLRKLIPVVAAKDSWRLHELSAVASQAFACRPFLCTGCRELTVGSVAFPFGDHLRLAAHIFLPKLIMIVSAAHTDATLSKGSICRPATQQPTNDLDW